MKQAWSVFAVAALWASTSVSQERFNLSRIGQADELERVCIAGASSPQALTFCTIFIQGVVDGAFQGQVMEAVKRGDDKINSGFCLPRGEGPAALAVTFVRWMQARPDMRATPSAFAISSAFIESYPC